MNTILDRAFAQVVNQKYSTTAAEVAAAGLSYETYKEVLQRRDPVYAMCILAFGEDNVDETTWDSLAEEMKETCLAWGKVESLEKLAWGGNHCVVRHEYSDGGWGYACSMPGDTFQEREERRAEKAASRKRQGYFSYVLEPGTSGEVVVEAGYAGDGGETVDEFKAWHEADFMENCVIVSGEAPDWDELVAETRREIAAEKWEFASVKRRVTWLQKAEACVFAARRDTLPENPSLAEVMV